MQNDFRIQLSADVDTSKIRSQIEASLKKNFKVQVDAEVSKKSTSISGITEKSSNARINGLAESSYKQVELEVSSQKKLLNIINQVNRARIYPEKVLKRGIEETIRADTEAYYAEEERAKVLEKINNASKQSAQSVDNYKTVLKNLNTEGKISNEKFKEFESSLNSLSTDFKNTSDIDNFNTKFKQLKNTVSETSTEFQVKLKQDKEASREEEKRAKALEKLNDLSTKSAQSVDNYRTVLKNLNTEGKISNEDFEEFNNELSSISTKFKDTSDFENFTKKFEELKNVVSETSASFQKETKIAKDNYAAQGRQNKRINQATQSYKGLKTSLKSALTQGKLTENQFESLNQKVDEAYETYTKTASSIDATAENEDALVEANKNFKNSLADTRREMSGFNAEIQSHSQDLSKIIVKYVRWIAVATLISSVTTTFKNLISEVKNLDAAMVELNKVYDATEQELKKVKNEAFDLADALGRTGKPLCLVA